MDVDLLSQTVPEKSSGQLHLKSFTPLWIHCPPFKHGLGEQMLGGSMGYKVKGWMLTVRLQKECNHSQDMV